MGIIICEKHGDQGIRLVCSHIAVSIKEREPLSSYIEVIDTSFGEYHLQHGYCEPCVIKLNLPSNGSPVSVDSDDEGEKIFGPLVPVCGACLAEAREQAPLKQSMN